MAKIPKQFIFLGVSFALLVFVFYKVGFKKMLEAIYRLPTFYVVIAAALGFLVICLDTMRLKQIVDLVKPIKFKTLLPIHIAGLLFNAITPGARVGGELIKSHFIYKETRKKYPTCLAAVVLSSIVYGLAFMVIAITIVCYALLFVELPLWLAILIFAVACLAIATILMCIQLHKRANNLESSRIIRLFMWLGYRLKGDKALEFDEYKETFLGETRRFVRTFDLLIKRKKLLGLCIAFQAASIILRFFVTYVIFFGFGNHVGFGKVVTVASLALLFGYFMILPGGIGVIEAAMITLYIVLGIAPGVAGTVALIDRGIEYVFVFAGGYASLVYLSIKYKIRDRRALLAGNGVKSK